MAELMRSCKGETNNIVVAVPASTAIAVGDVCVLESSAAYPAQSMTTTGLSTLALMQEAVHDGLVGVALDKRVTTQTTAGKGLFATTGVHTLDTATALTADVGTLVGLNGVSSSGPIYTPAQTVVSVATANLAIGRLVKAASSASTVEVEIVSTVTLGGPQTPA